MPRRPAHQKHQTITAFGTLAHIRIHGRLHRQHFRKGTDPVKIKQWILRTEMKYRRRGAKTGRLRDDAITYLASTTAMPTHTERRHHIDEWVAALGDYDREAITADQIRAELNKWKAAGSAASTVNHRRTALMHLYTVLDGKSAANPVKDVPKFAEPPPFPRAIAAGAIARLLSNMHGQDKARAMVIAYTGIPNAQLAQITRADIDLQARTVIVRGRKKGQGTNTSVRRLTTHGMRAFKALIHANAWGPFDRWALRRAVHAACEAAKIDPPIRPYDLRHFFGTEFFRRTGDIRSTQILMGHSSPTLTHRYTLGAVDERVDAAVERWDDE